jgi:hypothetical protein
MTNQPTVAEIMKRDRVSYLTALKMVQSGAPQKEKVHVEMWAVVFPDGRIITGSDMHDADHAWTVALGWPAQEEIVEAKKKGAFAVKATLHYEH